MSISNRKVVPVFVVAFLANFLLFALKLYVGLSSNSISIYSDGVNNLFDGISGVLSLVCFFAVTKGAESLISIKSEKTEQLLSTVLSCVIVFAGIVFFYNSAERMMYPTPVWYTPMYLAILCATAVAKLLMFLFFRSRGKSLDSDVLRIMSVDSLTDFFVNCVGVVTLVISGKGGYSVDALAGIVISIMIIIPGVRSVRENGRLLLNYPQKKQRERLERIFSEYGFDREDIQIDFALGRENRIFLKSGKKLSEDELEKLRKEVYTQTQMNLFSVK